MNDDKNLLKRAWAYAEEMHAGQTRKGKEGSPYTNHLVRVREVLESKGEVTDEVVLAAALLHDTIEDTKSTEEELTALFGPKITSVVKEVTDDKSLEKAERKARQIKKGPNLSKEACLVKLGDKIANVEDVLDQPADGWSKERRREYAAWAASVVSGLKYKHPALLAHFEELILRAEKELG